MTHTYTFCVKLWSENNKCFESCFKISTLDKLVPIEPVDRCSVTRTAILCGGKTPTEALYVDAQRKEFCEQVARGLSEELFNVIKKQDTINGYSQ